MRTIVAICAALAACAALISAEARVWSTATWAPRDGDHYVIETARDLVLADANAATGSLDATPGAPVQVAIDGRTVYVLDASKSEHVLVLVRSTPKYATTYTSVGSGHYIRSVTPGGTSLVLEDGSRWDIDPRQHFAVADWQAEELVSVRRSVSDPDFGYELVNTSQDDGTLANFRVR